MRAAIQDLPGDGAGGRGGQTFARAADRARLTPAAAAALRRLAEVWHLSREEAAHLIGASESTWDRIRDGAWRQSFSQDQLTRISAAVGVFKGLHLLFADAMADRWPRLPNRAPVFGAKSPVEAMIEGGIPRMLETRQYIDALRGGL